MTFATSMKPGDLVKMKKGYSAHGVVVSTPDCDDSSLGSRGPVRWVHILWSDEGFGLEKEKDLEVIQYGV